MPAAEENRVIEARPLDVKRGLLILAATVSVAAYELQALRRHPDELYRGILLLLSCLAALGCAWRLLFWKRRAERRRLAISEDGLQIGMRLYRWRDIKEFGLQNDFRTVLTFFRDNQKVYWTFLDSTELADLDGDDYAMDARALAERLNDQLRLRTGRDTSVHDGPKFMSQLLRPTVFYLRNFLFLTLAAVGLFLGLSQRWTR